MSSSRKPARRPWYPRYVEDYNNDDKVLGMSWAERGFFDFLLDLQWREGGIPADRRLLARLAKTSQEEFESHFGLMVDMCFKSIPGDASRLQNRKLEKVRDEQDTKNEKQRNRADKRWCRGNAAALPRECHFRSQRSEVRDQISEEAPREHSLAAPDIPVGAPSSADAPSSSTPASRTRKPRRPPKPKIEQPSARPRWQEIIAAYDDTWKALHSVDGKGPSLDRPDTSALARVYDRLGVDETISLVKRFVSDTDPFIARRGHILRDLPARINAYRTKQSVLSFARGRAVSDFSGYEDGVDIAEKLRSFT